MNPKVNLKALLSMDLPKIDPLSFLKRTLDPRRIYQNPKRLLNPMSIRGDLLYSGAADRLVGEEAGNAVRNAVAVNSLRQMLGLQALSALKYAAPAAALLLADQRQAKRYATMECFASDHGAIIKFEQLPDVEVDVVSL